MPWVRFTEDFDHKPKPGVTVAYKAGMHRLVTTPCAIAAVSKGKAVRQAKPKVTQDDSRQT